jgi:8-oxo-dGTP pyrophosphatase MutT (NUDIX family)
MAMPRNFGCRYVMYVPELDGFIMTADLEDPIERRVWRPVGGKADPRERRPTAVGNREAYEEAGLFVKSYEKIPLTTFINTVGADVHVYLVVVPESEARWMHTRGMDQVGFLRRRDVVAGTYKGLPVHARYRTIILDALPTTDALIQAA